MLDYQVTCKFADYKNRSFFLLQGEITEYFRYVKKLKPQDLPDYDYLKQLFLKMCQRIYVKGDQLLLLDWVVYQHFIS